MTLVHKKNLLLPEVERGSIADDDVVNLNEISACLDEIVAESRPIVVRSYQNTELFLFLSNLVDCSFYDDDVIGQSIFFCFFLTWLIVTSMMICRTIDCWNDVYD